jgi:hypothetical protein
MEPSAKWIEELLQLNMNKLIQLTGLLTGHLYKPELTVSPVKVSVTKMKQPHMSM